MKSVPRTLIATMLAALAIILSSCGEDTPASATGVGKAKKGTMEIWVEDKVDSVYGGGVAAEIKNRIEHKATAATGITVDLMPSKIVGSANSYQHNYYNDTTMGITAAEVGHHWSSLSNAINLPKIDMYFSSENSIVKKNIVIFTGLHEIYHHWQTLHDDWISPIPAGTTECIMSSKLSNVLPQIRLGTFYYSNAQINSIKTSIGL